MMPTMPALAETTAAPANPSSGGLTTDQASPSSGFAQLIQGLQPVATEPQAAAFVLSAQTDPNELPVLAVDSLAESSTGASILPMLSSLKLGTPLTPASDSEAALSDVLADPIDLAPATDSPFTLQAMALLMPAPLRAPSSKLGELSGSTLAAEPLSTAGSLNTKPSPLSVPASTVVSHEMSAGWQPPMVSAFLAMANKSELVPSSVMEPKQALLSDATGLVSPTETPKISLNTLSFSVQLGQVSTPPAVTTPALSTLAPHALLDPSWSEAFGQRVALLAQQGTQTATLQLNPADLGPIQIRIAMSEQGAKVEFNTLQQTTSDLITAAMPRLAAALEHQGMRLDESRVSVMSHRHDVFTAQSAFSPRQDSSGQGASPQYMMRKGEVAALAQSVDDGQELITPRTPWQPGDSTSRVDYYA